MDAEKPYRYFPLNERNICSVTPTNKTVEERQDFDINSREPWGVDEVVEERLVPKETHRTSYLAADHDSGKEYTVSCVSRTERRKFFRIGETHHDSKSTSRREIILDSASLFAYWFDRNDAQDMGANRKNKIRHD